MAESSGRIELHLRIRVAARNRAAFNAFLREAIPAYERPGGIRVHVLRDLSDSERFIEVVRYADEACYARDAERVKHDPEMITLLARWRALLEDGPIVEVYRNTDITP